MGIFIQRANGVLVRTCDLRIDQVNPTTHYGFSDAERKRREVRARQFYSHYDKNGRLIKEFKDERDLP